MAGFDATGTSGLRARAQESEAAFRVRFSMLLLHLVDACRVVQKRSTANQQKHIEERPFFAKKEGGLAKALVRESRG